MFGHLPELGVVSSVILQQIVNLFGCQILHSFDRRVAAKNTCIVAMGQPDLLLPRYEAGGSRCDLCNY